MDDENDDDKDDDCSSKSDDYDNDDHDDGGGLLEHLFDKSSLKQHIVAILVALVATAVSYIHFVDLAPSASPDLIPTAPKERHPPL